MYGSRSYDNYDAAGDLFVTDSRLWCFYWQYILIRSGDYELLLVISFLLFDVSTDGVPADCFICSCW